MNGNGNDVRCGVLKWYGKVPKGSLCFDDGFVPVRLQENPKAGEYQQPALWIKDERSLTTLGVLHSAGEGYYEGQLNTVPPILLSCRLKLRPDGVPIMAIRRMIVSGSAASFSGRYPVTLNLLPWDHWERWSDTPRAALETEGV